jgi:hypothetical protein
MSLPGLKQKGFITILTNSGRQVEVSRVVDLSHRFRGLKSIFDLAYGSLMQLAGTSGIEKGILSILGQSDTL